jgi:hypothetical protein
MRVRRILTLLLAYLCASAVAGFVLAVPLMSWMLTPLSGISWPELVDAVWSVSFYSVLVATFALPASLLAVAFGEARRITSLTAHVVTGAAIALAGFVLMGLTTTGSPSANPIDMLLGSPVSFAMPLFLPLAMVAGAAAGFVFWLIASRWPQRIPEMGEAPRVV